MTAAEILRECADHYRKQAESAHRKNASGYEMINLAKARMLRRIATAAEQGKLDFIDHRRGGST